MTKTQKSIDGSRPSWFQKFANAFRGLAVGMRGQNSYPVHLAISAAVVVAAFIFHVTAGQWCLLILCITLVLAAELFNTALERLAGAVTKEDNPLVRDALDISAAAVLATSIGALFVGIVVFAPKFVGQ